MRQLSELESM